MEQFEKKVFVVAYEFYPQNTGGSHRPFRIANYLKNNGYDVEVVTIDFNGDADPSLQQVLTESGLKLIRIPIKRSEISDRGHSFYFSLTDHNYKMWKSNILKYFKQYSHYDKEITVIVSVPPFSLSQFVIDLKMRFPKFKAILDLRDAWSQWNTSPYASRLHYEMTLKLEQRTMKRSDHIFVTSPVTKHDLIDLNKNINKDKLSFIPNSFEEYKNNKPEKLTVAVKDKLRIGYVGSFYFNPLSNELMLKSWFKKRPYQYFQYIPFKEYWLYRTPYFLFKSIKTLIEEDSSYESKIELNFIGKKEPWLLSMIAEFGFEGIVNLYGNVDKSEINSFLQQQDYLFITSSKKEGRKDCSIAGKTYEYFSNVKPILAYVAPGAQKDILQDSGLAKIIDPDNVQTAARELRSLIDNEITFYPNYNFIDRFLTGNALRPILKII